MAALPKKAGSGRTCRWSPGVRPPQRLRGPSSVTIVRIAWSGPLYRTAWLSASARDWSWSRTFAVSSGRVTISARDAEAAATPKVVCSAGAPALPPSPRAAIGAGCRRSSSSERGQNQYS